MDPRPKSVNPQGQREDKTARHPNLSFILHLFAGELGILGAGVRPPRFVITQVPDRRDQRRRTGRRSSAIASGVRRIHQGPCGTA